MSKFVELCKIIIDSEGHPKENEVLGTGYSMEHFTRLSNANPERLVLRAREGLRSLGIYYKEGNEC